MNPCTDVTCMQELELERDAAKNGEEVANAQLETMRADLAQAREEAQISRSEMQTIKAELASMRNEVLESRDCVESLNATVHTLCEEKQSHEQQIKTAQEQMMQSSVEVMTFRKELEKVSNEAAGASTTTSNAMEEIESLKADNRRLKQMANDATKNEIYSVQIEEENVRLKQLVEKMRIEGSAMCSQLQGLEEERDLLAGHTPIVPICWVHSCMLLNCICLGDIGRAHSEFQLISTEASVLREVCSHDG